jgi:hypothetical protein
MGMSMHDRYYEPEDDNDDIDEYIADWIQFESREGGYIDPKESTNFAEALGELGMREDIASWDDCTEAEKEQITAYWLEIGERLATDAYYDRNY